MSFRVAGHFLSALGICAGIAICTLYVAKSAAQSANNASPIYGVTIPDGFRDWCLISVNHLSGAGGPSSRFVSR